MSADRRTLNNRKPWSFFGPGTIATVILAMLMVGFQLLVPHKVGIERRVAPSGLTATALKPSAEQLLNWSDQLELTEKKREQLESIHQQERLALAPINADIDRQIKQFDKFTKDHKSVSMDDIQSNTAVLRELSQRKRVIEHGFSKQALELLTTEQQARASALLKGALSGSSVKQRSVVSQ